MPSKSPQEYVVEAIEAVLIVDRNEITPGARLITDLGADSLDKVDILMALEDDLSLSFDDEDEEQIDTVQDLISTVERKMKEHGRTNPE